MKHPTTPKLALLACLLGVSAGVAYAQQNVVQPGDPIVASSSNSPGSEGVANAIDGTQAKYLNFDSAHSAKPSGFVVTPSVGLTWVTGISMQSANDAPERDPKRITLEGSNDDTVTDFASGSWELIYKNDDIPAFATRYQTQTFSFENFKPYKHYRWTVVEVQTDNTCCMQIAEVQILGTTLPKNIVQPGDPIVASSSNSPGSEGVANAIDGTQAKYLNFDSAHSAKPSGFVVSPAVGATVVNGISMQSANDAPERDPKRITLEGSNDDTVTDFASGNWELVYKNDAIPAFATRYQTQTFLFDNVKPYKHYRWTVVEVQTDNTCCMQIAEVSLLGSGAPKNVVQPGDAIVASSSNSPGSEGVANAIDGTQAKYLNFDSAHSAKPSGFVVTPSVGPTTLTGISMQSANDAPERDPKRITLEGSNDATVSDFASGTWELIYKNDDIPAFATRYQTQTFYFPNKKSYKHYRWTVVEVQTDNTCCMQIAEVSLLAVTSQADCTKTAFLVQPVNTPVLSGSQATFFTTVNGPWPLQWYRNGTPIPGAITPTYTTEAITTANETNVYTVQIVGCQVSDAVKAVVFTPSSTKSIGIQFGGGGANGAGPQGGSKYVLPDDIVGVQLQAHWNIATNDSSAATGIVGDQVTLPDQLLDSSGAASTITFEYATSARWGAGTGTDLPVQRLLNGTSGAAGPGTDQVMTFHGVPAGKHSVLIYAVSPPLQFQTVSYAIGTQKYYVRVMNSDEYKPAPGFYRATSTDPAKPSVGNFIRFDNVSPDANGDIILTFAIIVGSNQATGVNAIQLVLNPPAVGDPPQVTTQPLPSVGVEGGSVSLKVQATGNDLTYQWRKNGRNLPNGGSVSGATTSTLTLSPLSAADEAVYSVAVFNPAGSTISQNAAVYLSKFEIKDALAGYWKFDETTGKSAANSVSGGKPAVFTGSPTWAAGEINNAVGFDGNTYATVETYPKGTKAISASAWVNVDAFSPTAVTFARNGQGALRAPGDNNEVPAGQFELLLDQVADDGTFRLAAEIQAGPNFPRAAATTAFPLGAWTQIGFTADGAQLRVYMNGQQVASTEYLSDLKVSTVNHLSIGAVLNTNDVGAIDFDATPNTLVGKMDDLAVWNRVLTADEMTKIYEAGKAKQALDTVTETPPTTDLGKLTVSVAQGNITVTWANGTLQTASSVNGPWTDSTAKSPLTEATAGTAKFYRTTQK